MIVAGGVYVERCVTPAVEALMGSGGRAAMALAAAGERVELHTFQPDHLRSDLIANFAALDVTVFAYSAEARIEFDYLFPLAAPSVRPLTLVQSKAVSLSGDAVVRFGCLEGEFIVSGNKVVYDPQAGDASRPFSRNGSTAETLAVVANADEAMALSGASTISEAAEWMQRHDGAAVVIIKDGAAGAHVFCGHGLPQTVPPYGASTIYKIGSGDIFTAVFARQWLKGQHPSRAADEASRWTAHYVETRQLQCSELAPHRAARVPLRRANVCLVGDWSTTAGTWLLEEGKRALSALGATVLSPYHDALLGPLAQHSAFAGAQAWNVVVSLSPTAATAGGTKFLQKAVQEGKRVLALAEDLRQQDELRTLGCDVSDDLSTVLYGALWEAA